MRGHSNAGFVSVRLILLTVVVGVLVSAAIPFLVKTPVARIRNSCEEFVMWAEAAKQVWAAENKKRADETPSDAELQTYMRKVRSSPHAQLAGEGLPFDAEGKLTNSCPAGGTVTIGPVSKRTRCSTMQWNEEYFQERYKRVLAEAVRR